jgi:hypothetical protein
VICAGRRGFFRLKRLRALYGLIEPFELFELQFMFDLGLDLSKRALCLADPTPSCAGRLGELLGT